MAEELGYFPVTDETSGATVMVPAKIKRHSTDQAIALAKYLQSTKSTMYGAFWCPHCIRQKELFGMEAFKFINYMECDPKGYKSQSATCFEKGVDGFPSWKFGNGKQQGGEMELMDIAKISGFLDKKGMNAFDANLEFGVPPLGSGASCQ
jgi:glutaredoxin